MLFMETIIGQDMGGFLCSPQVMANAISEIIGQAALSSDWESNFAIPEGVFNQVVNVMEDLREIKSSANVAALLAGRSKENSQVEHRSLHEVSSLTPHPHNSLASAPAIDLGHERGYW